jgi:hypothetical protein
MDRESGVLDNENDRPKLAVAPVTLVGLGIDSDRVGVVGIPSRENAGSI